MKNLKRTKKMFSSLLIIAMCLAMGTTAFAGTLYSSASVTVAANTTWNSSLYSAGNQPCASLDATVPFGGYAALMGANSSTGTRYVTAYSDSAIANEWTANDPNDPNDNPYYASFGTFLPGNYTHVAVRFKNPTSKSLTFKDVKLTNWGL